jgi:dienelactone hydrolase
VRPVLSTNRRAQIVRRRALAVATLAMLAAGIALILGGGGAHHRRTVAAGPSDRRPPSGTTVPAPNPAVHKRHARTASRSVARAPFAVGAIVVRLVDGSRTVRLQDGATVPRTLVTIVRYPAVGAPSGVDEPGATPAPAGPFPLIVFGHGFAVTPGIYAPLLRAWARAGYVVAAPAFPLGNANAPGGPNEPDLPNQPGDMKFVITRLLAASAQSSGVLAGLIDPRRIAVSGQSDGGDTALAVAYDPRYRDPRVRAAAILSGAEIPFITAFEIEPGGPPLLATQGTADTINPPSMTYAFYNHAPPPKYLLSLLGARHLPPYTGEQPQLAIVERVTLAFFDRYLKGNRSGVARMASAGNVAGVATLDRHP